VTREPAVYRGNPFQIEVGIVYGFGKPDEQIDLVRLANRVPLLYQSGACAVTEAVKDVDWKRYHMQQPGNNLPVGPMMLVVHMNSVWVPFVSESKEAIAPYPDIVKEMKLAIQDAGRKLSLYLSGKRRAGEQKRRLQIFERYAGEVAHSLFLLTNRNEKDISKKLKELIETRAKIRDEEFENMEEIDNNVAEAENKVKETQKQKTKSNGIEEEG
jgi:DNA topoisomerase-6 subunit B